MLAFMWEGQRPGMWTYLWPPLAGDLSEGFCVPSAQLGDWVSAESGMSMCASVVA